MELGPSRKALCSTLRTVKDHRTKNEEAGPRDASTHLGGRDGAFHPDS